jgi:predicted PurR-regulated permease PerM
VLPAVLWTVYATRSVLLPVLIAFVLAYAADPLVSWLQCVARVPRWVSAIGLMLAFAGAVAGLIVYLAPKVVLQGQLLIRNIPGYVNEVVNRLNIDVALLSRRLNELITGAPPARPIPSTMPATMPATTAADAGPISQFDPAHLDFRAIATTLLSWLDVGYEVIASTIGFATYMTLAVVIIAFCFYFFVWKFRSITSWFVPFIPQSHRRQTLRVLKLMDRSVSGFIRGRLVQSLVVAIVLSVGWSPLLANVPYYLLLGIGGGLLNLIPYAAVVAWPLAMLLAWLDILAAGQVSYGLDVWHVFILPTLVYLVAQGLDGWVIEPLVQGKVTNLEPATVLLAVLIGGSLAGLLGMLIAIPTAACLRILAQEVVLPKLKQWAAET